MLAASLIVAGCCLRSAEASGARAEDWQGEWGAWSRRAGEAALYGASISIFACDDAKRTCRLRFDTESKESRCSVNQEQGIELRISSPAAATAQLMGFDAKPKKCELTLTMSAEGGARSLRARYAGDECRYFCTSGGIYFPQVFPLQTTDSFPWLSARECFADARASRRAWCLDPALQRADQALEKMGDQITGLIQKSGERERLSAAREALLAACEHAAGIGDCLRAGYDKLEAEWDGARRAARQTHDKEEEALAAPGDAAQAAQLLQEIQGVYKKRFANALADGTGLTSEDILEIVPIGQAALYFRVHLEFYNGHVCNQHGIARFTRAGRFVFHARDEPLPGHRRCRLQIAVTGDEIQILDPESSCKDNCGMRGSFDRAAFPRSALEPIGYLDRLKRSKEYQESVAGEHPLP
ncbi:MAG TPA: hypothetical protein VHR45_22420 [Thermoanaerobaculia bacterium]|nr:hypothetical protein [Thermoanaerobaculia bacterium]